jgi:D-glycero-D-manno-heptose 1,7-bisphosphate phosphatase
MFPGVLLDRDGVVNDLVREGRHWRSPRSMDEFRYVPHIRGFLERVRRRGYRLAIVTNQPEVKRGLVSKETVELFHAKIARDLLIDDFFICWHDAADNCSCCKPKPGLVLEAARVLDLDLRSTFLVGDRAKDMQAARAAGCSGILLSNQTEQDTPCFPDLLQIASYIEDRVWEK